MAALSGVALAPAAAEWLRTTTQARLLNVFDRACNLINAEDAVLALVTSERGLTPFGLVVHASDRAPFHGLPAASPVRLTPSERCLALGPLRIDYRDALLWEAQPAWAAVAKAFADSPTALPRLSALAAETGLAGSLLDLFRPAAGTATLGPAMFQRAHAGARHLVAGLAAHAAGPAEAGAAALAGLGGGLTPAGDDFIVGALLAAWAGLYGAGAERLGPGIVAAAVPCTTTLSGAYLRAAAHGECTALWHTLFAALQRSDWPAAHTAVRALVSVGHTSGADALAGFLAVHYGLGAGA
jgi:hypothetical protein